MEDAKDWGDVQCRTIVGLFPRHEFESHTMVMSDRLYASYTCSRCKLGKITSTPHVEPDEVV